MFDDLGFDQGYDCGHAWAKEAEGLEPHNNLLEMRDDLKDFERHLRFDEYIYPKTYWEWLAACLIGKECRRDKMLSFWKWAVGADNLFKLENTAFIRGFADGARADWNSFYQRNIY